jgi:hypothetical protein
VVEAADAVTFDPSDGELLAAVRAAVGDDVGRALGASVERVLLTHDGDAGRLAGSEVC